MTIDVRLIDTNHRDEFPGKIYIQASRRDKADEILECNWDYHDAEGFPSIEAFTNYKKELGGIETDVLELTLKLSDPDDVNTLMESVVLRASNGKLISAKTQKASEDLIVLYNEFGKLIDGKKVNESVNIILNKRREEQTIHEQTLRHAQELLYLERVEKEHNEFLERTRVDSAKINTDQEKERLANIEKSVTLAQAQHTERQKAVQKELDEMSQHYDTTIKKLEDEIDKTSNPQAKSNAIAVKEFMTKQKQRTIKTIQDVVTAHDAT